MSHINNNKLYTTLWAAALLLYSSEALTAGQLSSFETAATESRDSREREESNRHPGFFDQLVSDLVSGMFSIAVDALFLPIESGTRSSSARLHSTSNPVPSEFAPRERGAPDLPFIRADFNYQSVHSNIEAYDARIEAGRGPLALQLRNTRFKEDKNTDTLDLAYAHGLLRLSWDSSFELNYGLGAIVMEGARLNSGLSATVPINIYPHPNWGIRFAPTMSAINDNTIYDLDASVSYIRPYISLRGGYRRIQAHEQILQGPYIGFSLHY